MALSADAEACTPVRCGRPSLTWTLRVPALQYARRRCEDRWLRNSGCSPLNRPRPIGGGEQHCGRTWRSAPRRAPPCHPAKAPTRHRRSSHRPYPSGGHDLSSGQTPPPVHSGAPPCRRHHTLRPGHRTQPSQSGAHQYLVAVLAHVAPFHSCPDHSRDSHAPPSLPPGQSGASDPQLEDGVASAHHLGRV